MPVKRASVSRNPVRGGLGNPGERGSVTARAESGSFPVHRGETVDDRQGRIVTLDSVQDTLAIRVPRMDRLWMHRKDVRPEARAKCPIMDRPRFQVTAGLAVSGERHQGDGRAGFEDIRVLVRSTDSSRKRRGPVIRSSRVTMDGSDCRRRSGNGMRESRGGAVRSAPEPARLVRA